MLVSYERWNRPEDYEQWPGGDDRCTLGKPLLIVASPKGTKIDCLIHGHHIIYGRKLWM